MVQTMGFGAYIHCVPLSSPLCTLCEFTLTDRVVITVYKGISPLSFIFKVCACIIIVSVSISVLLGERIGGNFCFGVDLGLVYRG